MTLQRTISVVVPAYNEERNLAGAVHDVVHATAEFENFEILIVNDGSTDGTGEVAEHLAQEIPQVTVIHHPRNLGFAAAYQTGLARARMDYFTFVPGDHEITPDSVRDIFKAVGSADLVVPYHATPWARAWHRRVLTRICTTQFNLLFGWHLRYYQGPTVYPTALARTLPIEAKGFFFVAEMLVHALTAGYSYVEVGLRHQERAYGRSKAVVLSNIVNAQKTIVRLWWNIRIKRIRPVPQVTRDANGKLLEGIES